MRRVFSVLVFIILITSRVSAQSSYPIYVSPSLTPPYSLKLSDYSKFGTQQLVVNIVVNDLNVANLPVKLHIKFETLGVTVENIPNLTATPIYLDGGAASILMGDDLKDYFDINNLSFKGYSKETYRRTGQLPEGFYKITVEVRHFQTNKLISNKGTATAWIAIGKPPVLKLPDNNKELGEFKGMPLVFSWLPCNLGSPVSAGNVQYKFEMWELRVDGISPYTVAATVPVFYEETTMNTMLSVLPSSLLMTPGMKYAWRVTAADINGFVPFEQDGHSEIRVFTYKSKCETVKNLKSKLKGTDGLFAWTPASNHTSYNIELRKPETGWLSASETFDNKAEFFDLDYGTKYELRVQSVCDNDPDIKSDFSEWVKLETPKKRTPPDSTSCPNCGCANNTDAGTVENLELKRDLKPGDTLVNRFGTTRFIVKSVEPQGDGVYKGHFLFWAELWKLKFICEYWDLSVNTDNVILNMDFQSVYNPQFLLDVDATTDYLNNLADAITELTANATIKDTLSVNETIASIYVNDEGELIAVTVDDSGQINEVVIKNNTDDIEETLIKGANGEEYVVTRDGDIMGVKEYKSTGGGNGRKIEDYIKENEKNHLSSTAQVDFTASQSQKYGFDTFTAEKETIKDKYPALGNGYVPAYKSVASYSTDRVVASTTDDKGITFRDQMGIPAIKSGDELTIRGGADGATTALYAYRALTDTTEEIAGKLSLMSFDEQAKKLYIVSVNNAHMPDAMELQNLLNKIYGQAVTRWEVVKIDKTVEVTFPNGQMTHGGSSAISVYNSDQKAIISKFKEIDDFERDAYYLFFVDNVKGKFDEAGDVAGFMPLQRQAGFIYDNPSLFIVAHELAHGAFNLRHTFSPSDLIAQKGNTKNLMDYTSSTELWKHQWDLIHDPENMLFAWAQDESEGEMATVGNSECYFSINTNSLEMSNQILNVTESNRDFNIKFHCKNDSVNLDSVYLLVNTDTIKNTNVTKKFLNNTYVVAKKSGSSDTLSFLDIRVDKDSLYAKFSTKISYKGEFGFDDGMDFSSISVPKVNMVYDTIHNSDGDVLYSPFITMDPNTTITIKASIINKMQEYNYFAESSSPSIICTYDTTTFDLEITNSNYTNAFNSPDHIYIYRKAKNNIETKQMIGKCEIFSMNKDSCNVYVLYYKHDTVPFTNTIVPSDLDDKLNKYSLNQSFKGFNVDRNIYSIIDSTVIDSIHLTTKEKAYRRILRTFMIDKVSNPGKYKSNSFYVIMSDLVFPDTGTPGAYSGGGVLGNSAYAIMWKVPFLIPADYPELIAHEGGHTFQLSDTFNDPILGNPAQKFSRYNYMDYFVTRYMFFKTQIKTMYNLKSTKE